MIYSKLRVIISGGGTGGHIFPAISIANSLKKLNPETEILFVGAEGKMEMEKVPASGYKIVGLPIVGLQRQLTLKNIINDIKVPFLWLASRRKAAAVIKNFKPDIAVGVGGYASGPLLKMAQKKKLPTLIQEQNSFAGLTNRMLGGKVGCVCVAYEGMDRFFPANKIVLSGNPIRSEIRPYTAEDRATAASYYGMDPNKKHIFVVGGSLGSRTLNECMKKWIEAGLRGGEDVEVLWQCGKYYKKDIDAFMSGRVCPSVHYSDFIARMDLAYALADVVISRSGASSVSEICAAAKAAVFVPSPNVAEDHQTHNAMALVNKGAALLVTDAKAPESLLATALELVHNPEKIASISKNAEALALKDAAFTIAEEIYKLVQK